MENTASHFSHPHPMNLIVCKQTVKLHLPCSACNLNISGTIYCCQICKDYFLHKSCFEMPERITHPFHKQHPLALITEPAYGDPRFRCDACGERGKGFSYSCKPCGVNLHMLCATMPLSVTHASHGTHKLILTFESPYAESKFTCDICRRIGSRQWLYRCGSCRFDAHLKCAAAVGDFPAVCRLPSQSSKECRSLEGVQQMIIKNSKAIAQAILSEGSGGSGENRGFHMLLELISALNDSGTSCGGQDSLPTVMGGDGGGREYSQAVTRDRGGGSLPKKLTHPIDKRHALTLLAKPAYGKGRFRCDACRESGYGYSYHCRLCGIDLHVSCAMLPLSVTHDSHVHTLYLIFESLYSNNKFPCDVCMRPGSRQWLYRCKPCGFNAHLNCAAGDIVPRVHNQSRSNEPMKRPQDAEMAHGLMQLITTGVGGGDGEEDYQQLLGAN
ncbi:hypothetical protein ABFX02_02G127500 [Erythranthe guttata]